MIEITEATVFRTPDGKSFEDREEAEKHMTVLAVDARIAAYLEYMEASTNAKTRAGRAIRGFLLWEMDQCRDN